jgi:hypothetical protein
MSVEGVIDGVVVGVASFAAHPGSTEISTTIIVIVTRVLTVLLAFFNPENMVLLLFGK